MLIPKKYQYFQPLIYTKKEHVDIRGRLWYIIYRGVFMQSNMKFWNTVTTAIEATTQSSSKIRNGLYDIALAAVNLKKSLDILPQYLNRISDVKICMEYNGSRGYLVNLNYFRDNPSTKKEDVPRIQNIMNLGLGLRKMEDFIENKKNVEFYTHQMTLGLQMMIQEAEALLLEEIKRTDLKEILKSVINKKSYLENYLGITSKTNVVQYILERAR